MQCRVPETSNFQGHQLYSRYIYLVLHSPWQNRAAWLRKLDLVIFSQKKRASWIEAPSPGKPGSCTWRLVTWRLWPPTSYSSKHDETLTQDDVFLGPITLPALKRLKLWKEALLNIKSSWIFSKQPSNIETPGGKKSHVPWKQYVIERLQASGAAALGSRRRFWICHEVAWHPSVFLSVDWRFELAMTEDHFGSNSMSLGMDLIALKAVVLLLCMNVLRKQEFIKDIHDNNIQAATTSSGKVL